MIISARFSSFSIIAKNVKWRSTRKGPIEMCGQYSSWLACAFMQSDLRATLLVDNSIKLYFKECRTVYPLYRLAGCAGWSWTILSIYVIIPSIQIVNVTIAPDQTVASDQTAAPDLTVTYIWLKTYPLFKCHIDLIINKCLYMYNEMCPVWFRNLENLYFSYNKTLTQLLIVIHFVAVLACYVKLIIDMSWDNLLLDRSCIWTLYSL